MFGVAIRQYVVSAMVLGAAFWCVSLVGLPSSALAFHDADRDRIYDLNNPIDETTVQNMTPAEQRVLMEAQHPGISKWNQWKVMERHPDTGAIIACRRYSKYNCKEFASPDDYQRYLIYEFEGHKRRRYGYLKRHYVYPKTYGASSPQPIQQSTQPVSPITYSPQPITGDGGPQVTTTYGGNQWEYFDQ